MPDPKDPRPQRERVEVDVHTELKVRTDRAREVIARTRREIHEIFDPTYTINLDMRHPYKAIDDLRAKVLTALRQIKGLPGEVTSEVSSILRTAANRVVKEGKFTEQTFRDLQKAVERMARTRETLRPEARASIDETITRVYDAITEIVSGTAHDMSTRLVEAMSDLPAGTRLELVQEARDAALTFQEEIAQFYGEFKTSMEDFRRQMEDYFRRMEAGEAAEMPSIFDAIVDRQKTLNRLLEKQKDITDGIVRTAKELAQAEQSWMNFWREIIPGGMREDRLQALRPQLPREALERVIDEISESGMKVGKVSRFFARRMAQVAPYLEKFDIIHVGAGGVRMGSALSNQPGILGSIAGSLSTTGGLYMIIAGAFMALAKVILSLSDTMSEFNKSVLETTAGMTRLSTLVASSAGQWVAQDVREAYLDLFHQTNSLFNMFTMTQEEILEAVTSLQAAGDSLQQITAIPMRHTGRPTLYGGTAQNAVQEMAFVVKTYSTLLGQTVQETGQMLADFHDQLLIPFEDLDKVMASVTDDMYASALGANKFFTALREITNAQRLYNSNLLTTSRLLSTLGRSLTATSEDAAQLARTFSTQVMQMSTEQRAALIQFGGVTGKTFAQAREQVSAEIATIQKRVEALDKQLESAATYEERRQLRARRDQLRGRLMELQRRRQYLNPRGLFEMARYLPFLPQEQLLAIQLRAATGARGDTRLQEAINQLNALDMTKVEQVLGITEEQLMQMQKTLEGLPAAYVSKLEELRDKATKGGGLQEMDRRYIQQLGKVFGIEATGREAEVIGKLMTSLENMTINQFTKLATLVSPPTERRAADIREEAAAMVQETVSLQKMLETTIGGLLKWIGGLVADIRNMLYKLMGKLGIFGDVTAFGDFSAAVGQFQRYTRDMSVEVTKKIRELEARRDQLSPESAEYQALDQQISNLEKAYESLSSSQEKLQDVYEKVQRGEVTDTAAIRAYQKAAERAMDNFSALLKQEGVYAGEERIGTVFNVGQQASNILPLEEVHRPLLQSLFTAETAGETALKFTTPPWVLPMYKQLKRMILPRPETTLPTVGQSVPAHVQQAAAHLTRPAGAVAGSPPMVSNTFVISRALLSPAEIKMVLEQFILSILPTAREAASP